MKSLAVALLPFLLGLAGAAPSPQTADSGQVAWAKSWEEARIEARERNVPIFFTIQQDDNDGCKQMEAAFRDDSFVRQSRRIVCVVMNPDTRHGQREKMDGKMKVQLCRAYDGMSCDTHVHCQNGVEHLIKRGSFGIPLQVWCRPDGTELFRHDVPDGGGAQNSSALVKDMERAFERVSGPKLSRREWYELKKLLMDGDEALGRLDFKAAAMFFKKLSDAKSEKFANLGKTRYENLIKSCERLVLEAVKQYQKSPGSDKKSVELRAEAKAMLTKISKELKGTEVGQRAGDALKGLK